MELFFLAMVLVAAFAFFSAAINDRNAAKKAGEPTGSLRWHFKQHTAKEEAKKKERKAAKLAKKQHKNNPKTTPPNQSNRVFSKKGNDLPQSSQHGRIDNSLTTGELRFTYEDFNGNITSRRLKDWSDDSEYIKGFCLDRHDQRTFRKDRIIAFSSGENLLRSKRPAPKPIRRNTPSTKPMEILFTGFAKARRAELEAQALDEGMIVRTRVTQALDFLCVGPKAAPSKQVEAEHRGAIVLDEMAFYDLLESGELPDR
tara:strand:+ start:5074 stop:5844 length:771 start_codon:yes stop_codon:yes gene_type:complete